MCAYERKAWLPNEDDVIRRLVALNEKRQINEKLTWNQIATHLVKQIPSSKRTGKQCRQRWHNQLDPNIKRYEVWSEEQINKLFRLQNQIGNKWSKIAQELTGRTDNNVKNYFYSSLRRALRKVNQYISIYKKKSNMKQFQLTLLTKILAISDEKNRDKLDIRADKADQLALEIKYKLTELSKQEDNAQLTPQNQNFKESLIKSIQQFNKSCKKKKSKKVTVNEELDFHELTPNYQEESPQKSHSVSEKEMKREEKQQPLPVILAKEKVLNSKGEEGRVFPIIPNAKSILELVPTFSKKQSNQNGENPFKFQEENTLVRENIGHGFFNFNDEASLRKPFIPMMESVDMTDMNRVNRALEDSLVESSIFSKIMKQKQEQQ